MMRKLQLGLWGGLILFFLVFFSSVSVSSSGKEGLMLPLDRSKSNLVNLEVTHLYHVLKWVKWREDDLPPAGKPVKCLIVGKDDCRFSKRLSFLIAESETLVAGHGVQFLNFEKLDDALWFTQKDSSVLVLVCLDSIAGDWNHGLFPKRRAMIVYGQSDKFRKQGITFFSFSKGNRIRLMANVRRANSSGVTLSTALLKHKRFFHIENENASKPEGK
jgi:hypothetical protein